jgi:hypothetical protein
LVTPPHQRSMTSKIPGEERVASSSAPLRAVRMPDEASSPTEAGPPGGLIMGEVHEEPKEIAPAPETETLTAEHFRVLVAEDDPVNSRIVKKRLEKLGHNVYLTLNGEECASAFCDNPRDFDVVLMDMQVSEARYNAPCSSLTASQDANRGWTYVNKDDSVVRKDAYEHIFAPCEAVWPSANHSRFSVFD